MGLGFELKALPVAKQVLYYLSHISSPFCSGYFGDGVWPPPVLFLISASQVARITGMSHGSPAVIHL
jgi:hypothetical protein